MLKIKNIFGNAFWVLWAAFQSPEKISYNVKNYCYYIFKGKCYWKYSKNWQKLEKNCQNAKLIKSVEETFIKLCIFNILFVMTFCFQMFYIVQFWVNFLFFIKFGSRLILHATSTWCWCIYIQNIFC